MSEHTSRQARRQSLAWKGLLGAFLTGAVCGVGYHIARDMKLSVSPVLLGLVFAAIILAGFVASVVYWRNIDEAAREAHKFAWLWGGSSAMLLGLPLPFLIGDVRLIALMGQLSPAEWVATGVVALITAQLIGYGLAWAGWWLRQR
jgi:hypothetical protein